MKATLNRIILEAGDNRSTTARIKYLGTDAGRETEGTLGTLYYLDGQVVLCGESGKPSAIFKNNGDVLKHLRRFEVPVSCEYKNPR